ncbi:hypothetical protein PPERSA_06168 [Pseudocohnilembus persalinus]|uniref:Uncharacterized protein n=1 Tax=Pseudocohnilembus persalinus TaxID=266149 RepID=A0A0V0R0C9_PSEPJ|nr:hypothetical protein PPERSA_06168 [Pseudocohnilembus persalinus]|eukprot:KRX07990.1 hypothetical protein PPERSA_06168 [Pseudocohnilembus persalinus]
MAGLTYYLIKTRIELKNNQNSINFRNQIQQLQRQQNELEKCMIFQDKKGTLLNKKMEQLQYDTNQKQFQQFQLLNNKINQQHDDQIKAFKNLQNQQSSFQSYYNSQLNTFKNNNNNIKYNEDMKNLKAELYTQIKDSHQNLSGQIKQVQNKYGQEIVSQENRYESKLKQLQQQLRNIGLRVHL